MKKFFSLIKLKGKNYVLIFYLNKLYTLNKLKQFATSIEKDFNSYKKFGHKKIANNVKTNFLMKNEFKIHQVCFLRFS